ncbi:MAG: hypothetical protein IT204_12845 [Fimbriimonadaceae bacterium]|nr:hypothetical protein [Fimbriimonadaceae bacterium]
MPLTPATVGPAHDPTPRRSAVVAAALLAPVVGLAVWHAEILHHSADLASSALPVAGLITLLLLLLLRVLLGGRLGSRAILLAYATVSGTVGLCTMGLIQFLVPALPAPFFFATPENRYAELLPYLPRWAVPQSQAVVQGFFLGTVGLPWGELARAWALPLLAWGGFLLLVTAAMGALAGLVHPRWSRAERLTYPLVLLPLALADPTRRADLGARSTLLAGALVALLVQSVNALHQRFPAVPSWRVLPIEIAHHLPPPWNALRPLEVTFYPAVIGLFALVPSEILLSCSLCFAVARAGRVIGAVSGLGATGFPWAGEQAQGALLGSALLALWLGRHGWRQRLTQPDGRRLGAVLLGAGALLVAFGHALGMRWLVSLWFWLLFGLAMLGIGRLRAAVGPIWNPGTDLGWLVRATVGGGLTVPDRVGLTLLRWCSFGDWRAHPLPMQLDALRLCEAAGIPARRLTQALAWGTLLTVAAGLLNAVLVYHREGAATAACDPWRLRQGQLPFELLRAQLDVANLRLSPAALPAVVAGGLTVSLLQGLHTRVLGWPLHPAGYVLAISGALDWMWCPILVSWTAKSLLLRSGGLPRYRRALPIFLGLILGDFSSAGVLAAIAWWTGQPQYKPFPI